MPHSLDPASALRGRPSPVGTRLPSYLPPASADPRPVAPRSMLSRMRDVLTRRIRLERRGFDVHFILEPAPRPAAPAPALPAPAAPARPASRRILRPDELPPLGGTQLAEARADLRAILAQAPRGQRHLPSLALLERVLAKDGARGIDEVPAAVLRHAASALDQFADDDYSPGLVVLRRRIAIVLRRRHGDLRAYEASAPGPLETGPSDFADSMTEFIDLDRLFDGSRR
jgi:hypothetical protein